MDRLLLRSAAVALCAVWASGCAASDASDPTSAAAANAQTAAAFPSTLQGEIARAHSLRLSGSFEDASKALGQLMLVAPDDVRVVGEYGKLLAEEGRADEAVPFLKRAVQLDADDFTLYSALGVAYDQIDDHAKARTAYEHALTLKPGAPEVLNNYAVSRMLSGDLDGAQRLLAQAALAGSQNPKIADNMALLASMRHPQVLATTEIAAAPPKPAASHAIVAAATPKAQATRATTVVGADAAAAPRVATAAPKPLVVMEKVPFDPKAGPVASHKPAFKLAHEPRPDRRARPEKPKLAAAPAHGPHAVQAGEPPVLRTAADGQ